MSEVDLLVDALMERVRDEIAAAAVRVVYGTFVATEDDASLSRVIVEGEEYRNVRRLVGTTSLTAGKTVMCLSAPGWALTIIDVIA